jgi:hypothetical protein
MTMKSKNEKWASEGIGRRDFICKSALFCCMANIPFAASGISKNTKQEEKKSDVNPMDLATYCGLYCGACDIYQKRIGKSGHELKSVLDAYNFGDIAKEVPGLEGYDTFYKTLNTLISIFGQCPACQKGGGDPECKIRLCCKEKGYQTCAECPSLPCEKLKPLLEVYPGLLENLKEIKEGGLEKWCRKQQEMVDKGFRYSGTLSEK